MNFDSIISIFLIFIFFVLPIVLKRLQAKNKAAVKPGPATKKKVSLFERMGEQIQEFVKDLEQQAKAEKEAEGKKDGIWERLAEDEKTNARSLKIETPIHEKRRMIGDEDSAPQKMGPPVQTGFNKKREAPVEKSGYYCPESYALNSRRKLRQAVVWSEILSKPVALREK
jgi:hypothetical protein